MIGLSCHSGTAPRPGPARRAAARPGPARRAAARPGPGRRAAAALLACALAAALLLGFAQPASAHANLISTDPGEGAVLQVAPKQVRFTFDDAVRAVPDGVQVFDSGGGAVGAAATVNGTELEVALTEPLRSGTTVVVWRVVSEDGHPVGGSLTFSVGAPTAGATPPGGASGTPDVPVALTLARWVGYLGLLLAAGLVAFSALFLPTDAQAGRARRRLAVAARAAAAVAVVAWLAALPLTAVYLSDGRWSSLTRGSTWSSLPLTDRAVPAIVVGGLVLAVALLGRGSRQPGVMAVVAAAVAVASPALTGHTRAASPEELVVGVDMLHLLAGSLWLGGLVALALTLSGLSGRGAVAATVLARFSAAAAGVLAVLVATGSVLAWRILGSWSALLDTTYGQLLLVKIGIVLVVLAIAAWNRWSLLPRLRRAAKQPDRQGRARPVARATAIEGAILVTVLLVTGFLVDKSPEGDPAPASAAATTEPGPRTTTLGEIGVAATITPLTRGPNTVTIKLTSAAGEPTEGVAPPVVRLSGDQATLGTVPLTQVSAGVYTAPVVLPAPGAWRMQVSLRVSEFSNPVGELEFVVNG